jgi:leucyl aminopeptidase
MQAPEIQEPLAEIATQALVLFHLEDEPAPRARLGWVDWVLLAPLSRLRARGKFTGARGSSALLSPGGKLKAERVLVIGLGHRQELSLTHLYRLSYQVAQTILSLGCTTIALEIPSRAFPREPFHRLRKKFLEGFTAELRRGRPGAEFTLVTLPPEGEV